MASGLKWTFGAVILAGLGLAQWKYDLVAQAQNYYHPQQAQTSDAKAGTQAQGAPGAGGQ